RVGPGEGRIAESVIFIHVLGGADVPDNHCDRALAIGGNPLPIFIDDRAEVAHQRVPLLTLESLVEEIKRSETRAIVISAAPVVDLLPARLAGAARVDEALESGEEVQYRRVAEGQDLGQKHAGD